MASLLLLYRNAYGGLSREAWLLATVMFIHRTGAMVIPFLSVYLSEGLGLSIKQVGVLLSLFGVGAMVGNFLGGWLTDRRGHFKVLLISFGMAGTWLLVMPWLQQFGWVAAGLFLMGVFMECLSPANGSAVSFYAPAEHVTRAFSLNRLAMNLGFCISPVLGGVLAMLSFKLLFFANCLTCVLGGVTFYLFFKKRQKSAALEAPPERQDLAVPPQDAGRAAHRDGLFLVFLVLCCGYLVVFSQFFTTIPLFWDQVYSLSKMEIGALLAFEGLLVCLMEMVIVYLIGNQAARWKMIVGAVLLMGGSFLLLNLSFGWPVLLLSILFLGFSEILSLPFISTLIVQRSTPQNRGSYMGLYTLSYSAAYIVGPLAGTTVIDRFGFSGLWLGCCAVCVLLAVALYVVVRRLQASITLG